MSTGAARFVRTNCGRRRFLSACLLAGLPLPGATVAAGNHDVRVIVGDSNPTQQQIVQALLRRFPAAPIDRDADKLVRAARPRAYLTIGPDALRAGLRAQLDAPLVSLFTSRQTCSRLLAGHLAAGHAAVTGIYAEPSPEQQMQLIAALYGRQVTVGAVVSAQTAYMAPLLERAARQHRLDLALRRVEPEGSLVRTLTTLTAANVLLIFPDSSLYNAENLRQLLEASYRRSQPVIGFSAGLVSAGALASAYSSVNDTLGQLDSILELIAAGQVPGFQYPSFWAVAVNERVARSLNVGVDDAIRTMGNRPP